MKGTGGDLLAGSGFSGHENRRVGGRYPFQDREHLPHGKRAADQRPESMRRGCPNLGGPIEFDPKLRPGGPADPKGGSAEQPDLGDARPVVEGPVLGAGIFDPHGIPLGAKLEVIARDSGGVDDDIVFGVLADQERSVDRHPLGAVRSHHHQDEAPVGGRASPEFDGFGHVERVLTRRFTQG